MCGSSVPEGNVPLSAPDFHGLRTARKHPQQDETNHQEEPDVPVWSLIVAHTGKLLLRISDVKEIRNT